MSHRLRQVKNPRRPRIPTETGNLPPFSNVPAESVSRSQTELPSSATLMSLAPGHRPCSGLSSKLTYLSLWLMALVRDPSCRQRPCSANLNWPGCDTSCDWHLRPVAATLLEITDEGALPCLALFSARLASVHGTLHLCHRPLINRAPARVNLGIRGSQSRRRCLHLDSRARLCIRCWLSGFVPIRRAPCLSGFSRGGFGQRRSTRPLPSSSPS